MAVRARINEMLEDGLTYPAIIQALGEDGKGLDSSSLSRWKSGGYRDWLVERAFVEVIRNRQETPGELAKDFDASETSYAALQLAVLQMFEALRDLSPAAHVEEVEGGRTGRTNRTKREVKAGALAGRDMFTPSLIDSEWRLPRHFMAHQVAWIQTEEAIHNQHRQVVALAEKSARIGWTYADAFKNVRKRLGFALMNQLATAQKRFPQSD